MKLPHRRQFLHLAAGAAALPAVSRIAWAQAYPTRPVRIVVGFAPGGAERHQRAPHRPMAVGAARPAFHHRQPTRRQRQYRHGVGRAITAGRLYARHGRAEQRGQRDPLRESPFHFPPRHRAGRSHQPQCSSHGGASVGSRHDWPRPDRLRQGQSEQAQYGVARKRDRAPYGGRVVQDDDRRTT